MQRTSRDRGFSLVELLLVIVVLGIAASTVMMASTRSGAMSARMLRDQQMTDLAQSLLAEVQQMPFTYCDPDLDANAATAGSSAACASTPEVLGAEGVQTRLGPARFNNVTDYDGYQMPGPDCASLCDVRGVVLPAATTSLGGCSARVAVVPAALGAVAALDASGRPQSVHITVTVTCPSANAPTVAEGFRMRHAPRSF